MTNVIYWKTSNTHLPSGIPVLVSFRSEMCTIGGAQFGIKAGGKDSHVAIEPGIACDADAGDRDAAWGAAAASKLAGRDDGEGRGGFGRRGHGPFAAAGGSGAICFTVRAPWHGTSVSRREDCRGK